MGLTHLSLFSGIGGLDLAAEMAGFETVGQCEWADFPSKVLEKHWPGLPRWRDIHTLTGEDFYAKTGLHTVDLVSGGFPCQPFSLSGKRRGTADDRHLWPEMLRVIQELRPTWVIGENVGGLVSMVESRKALRVEGRSVNRFPDSYHYEAAWVEQENMLLVELIGDLERLGYSVQALVIPACAVGASHRRDRLALAAHRDGGGYLYGWDEEHPAEAGEHAQCQSGGCGEDVADAQRVRLREDRYQSTSDPKWDDSAHREEREAELCTAGRGGCNVPNADQQMPHGRIGDGDATGRSGFADGGRRSAQPGLGVLADGIPAWMDRYWLTEQDIPRVATSVPDRVDKLKAYGNAVYWRQFYPIMAGIYHIETGGPQ